MGRAILGRYLESRLPRDDVERLVKSFDVVGDIAVIKVPPELGRQKQVIAAAVMAVNRNVKTVLNQVSAVSGELRLRNLEWIAGEEKTKTTYRESGCAFYTDLAEVYFSPRLSFERMRIAQLVREGESVVNMFAGVGCFSIVIGKHSHAEKVYSIDLNPVAVELMKKNIALNKLEPVVEEILGDAKEVMEKRLRGVSHRVLMPLPEKAYEYLDVACLSLKPEGGVIHYYDFVSAKKGEDAIAKTTEKVRQKLTAIEKDFKVVFSRVVRTVGPNWSQVVLDLNITS